MVLMILVVGLFLGFVGFLEIVDAVNLFSEFFFSERLNFNLLSAAIFI